MRSILLSFEKIGFLFKLLLIDLRDNVREHGSFIVVKNMDINLGTAGLEHTTCYMNELLYDQRTIAPLALSH